MDNTPLPLDAVESDHLRSVALTLGIPLGVFGAHRFYVGKTGTGVLQLLSIGGLGLWWLYDMILIMMGEFRDEQGRRVSRWVRDETADRLMGNRTAVNARLTEELEGVQTEVRELAERVDFLERLLAQVREKGQLAGEKRP